MKTYFTRIVTFMDYPPLSDNPKELLAGGSRTITQGDKVRVFVPKKVYYDDNMTPLFTEPLNKWNERKFKSLEEIRLCPEFKPLFDSPVLDWDHSLKIYEP